MLMRRPVSCFDPARGIILVEIKFRNSRDPRDDSRAFEEALLQIAHLYGIMEIVRLSERSASYARYYNYTARSS